MEELINEPEQVTEDEIATNEPEVKQEESEEDKKYREAAELVIQREKAKYQACMNRIQEVVQEYGYSQIAFNVTMILK